MEVLDSVVVDCRSRGEGFKSLLGQKFGSRVLLFLYLIANLAIMSTLTVHCRWKEEKMKERTSHQPSYADAKKMKLLSLYTQG